MWSVALGALATVRRDGAGAPYVSLVPLATDHQGAPLLLLSALAEHSRNLEADPRASLLLAPDQEHDDPLAGERATLVGRIARSDDPAHRRRYLARHPQAAVYADFSDFAMYRMSVERAHLVAGFGRIHWVDRPALELEPAPALAAHEADIVAHMNEEHRDAVQLYARVLLGQSGSAWTITGVDPQGCDLRQGRQIARLDFATTVTDAAGARAELVRLVKLARERSGAAQG